MRRGTARSRASFLLCSGLGRSGRLDPAAVRVWRWSALSSRNHAARARAETVEGRLCAAVRAGHGLPLWRKSKSAAALLSVPGDHQPSPPVFRELYLKSLIAAIGIDSSLHSSLCRGRLEPNARRVGLGWEFCATGMKYRKFTYFQGMSRRRMRAGGRRAHLLLDRSPVSAGRRQQVMELNFMARRRPKKVTTARVLAGEQEYSLHISNMADTVPFEHSIWPRKPA